MIEFEFPYAWWLLPLPWLVYRLFPPHRSASLSIRVPHFTNLVAALGVEKHKEGAVVQSQLWQKWLILSSWILLVAAVAKPVTLGESQTRELSGRDLMILVDLSGSMATQDFSIDEGKPISRLQAAKQVLGEFSHHRAGDRFGLILFGDKAYVQSPFTADMPAWNVLLDEAEIGMAGESTRLGDAIGLGIKVLQGEQNRLLSSQDKTSKAKPVMILLTDGNDTDSLVPPHEATKIAKAKEITLYVIAMGSLDTTGEEALDMDGMHEFANQTGGLAFLAQSKQELEEAYGEIDRLEPKVFESYTFQPKVTQHHWLVVAILAQYWVYVVVRIMFATNRVKKGG
tara:strand:+ start:961 stop:1983 length:1023 start_codon:yes stop_codon:yes gene_type:complete